jgi:cytochrome c553
MKKWVCTALLALLPAAALAASSTLASSTLDWAYPVPPPDLPPSDNKELRTAKGSTSGLKLTVVQINDEHATPDWFPNEHPPMPPIVAHGRAPHIPACIMCHLPNGTGHPESSNISALTPNYIVAQMHAFRDGNRTGIRAVRMIEMAKDITEDELKEAAAYFAAIKPENQKWVRVVESATAPKNHIGPGGKRVMDKTGGTVPIAANMIYEIAEDEDGALNRDQHYGAIDYVPMGSIAKGEALATTGGNGKTVACAICHGPDLKGLGDVPRLAGRPAYYTIRQLNDIKTGARKGDSVALMQTVVAKLSDEDMVNLAAYTASRH